MLPCLRMLKTTMGKRLSIQSVIAVVSMTSRPRSRSVVSASHSMTSMLVPLLADVLRGRAPAGALELDRPRGGPENEVVILRRVDHAWNDPEQGVNLVATGEVPGWILSQFSLDEFDGHLRIVTSIFNSG